MAQRPTSNADNSYFATKHSAPKPDNHSTFQVTLLAPPLKQNGSAESPLSRMHRWQVRRPLNRDKHHWKGRDFLRWRSTPSARRSLRTSYLTYRIIRQILAWVPLAWSKRLANWRGSDLVFGRRSSVSALCSFTRMAVKSPSQIPPGSSELR